MSATSICTTCRLSPISMLTSSELQASVVGFKGDGRHQIRQFGHWVQEQFLVRRARKRFQMRKSGTCLKKHPQCDRDMQQLAPNDGKPKLAQLSSWLTPQDGSQNQNQQLLGRPLRFRQRPRSGHPGAEARRVRGLGRLLLGSQWIKVKLLWTSNSNSAMDLHGCPNRPQHAHGARNPSRGDPGGHLVRPDGAEPRSLCGRDDPQNEHRLEALAPLLRS